MILSNHTIITVCVTALAAVLAYVVGRRDEARKRRKTAGAGHECCGGTSCRNHADECERGLADALSNEFAMMDRYRETFSTVVFAIDNVEHMSHRESDRALSGVHGQLAHAVRETDVLVRHNGGQFYVLMPRTDLMGASELGDRLRQVVGDGSSFTVSGGITMALDGDSPGFMAARATDALATAQQSDGDCVFRHDGRQVEPILEVVLAGDSVGEIADR